MAQHFLDTNIVVYLQDRSGEAKRAGGTLSSSKPRPRLGCSILLTEDLAAGSTIGGVEMVNPVGGA